MTEHPGRCWTCNRESLSRVWSLGVPFVFCDFCSDTALAAQAVVCRAQIAQPLHALALFLFKIYVKVNLNEVST